MKLIIPIHYDPEHTKNYYSGYNTPFLREKLLESSNDYCMYTYHRIAFLLGEEKRHNCQLDHSVEKSTYKGHNLNPLHCKFNIACVGIHFNLSFKKKFKDIDDFKNDFTCDSSYDCKCICNELQEKFNDYSEKNNIILMPNSKYPFKDSLIFNLRTLKFEVKLTFPKLELLENHIIEMELNGNNLIRKSILKFCGKYTKIEDPLYDVKFELSEPDNFRSLILENFFKYLSTKNNSEIKSICSVILNFNEDIPLNI